MPWFDKNNAAVPEKLRNLDQASLEAAVDFYNANKDKVPQLETELTTTKQTLANVESEFTATKNKVADLEARVGNPPATPPGNPPAQPQPADWLTNPEQAFMENVKPLADFALNQGTQLAQLRLETYLKDQGGRELQLYHKYNKEIRELMSKETPTNQANPQVWLNAHTMVKGHHFNDIMTAVNKNDVEFFGETPTRTPQQVETSNEITDADKAQASRFGITPEAVRDARKGIKYGDPEPQQRV